MNEPIAIVGIGCRFPGNANSPKTFWNMLREGRDAIERLPDDRFDIEDFLAGGTEPVPGRIASPYGGFIDHVDKFDPFFFGMSPREVESMDVQHRLLLEVAWEGIEDAGLVPAGLTGRAVGVFVGLITADYADMMQYYRKVTDIDLYSGAGGARSVASGRISYAFGLEGPSMTIDTACSSSLVTVHLACQSLRSGESELALAGGVNLVLVPETSLGFSQASMLAPDGRCKAFDASGNGFVRSDGVGMLVLKRLSQAEADGDAIYATIEGSAVNNDGRGVGLMTPRREGQEAVLRRAWRNAGIRGGDLGYVETHGTGTRAGDPVEVGALGAALGDGDGREQPCFIGSVKTNIGHTEGAAGVAGLIKTILAVNHGTVPPNLHFRDPNPAIDWDRLPVRVPTAPTPWPLSGRPVAGVSSFGISGTNAHIVVRGPEPVHAKEGSSPSENDADGHRLAVFSAKTQDGLARLAADYADHLNDQNQITLRDLAFTLARKRTHHPHRLCITAENETHLAEQLRDFVDEGPRAGIRSGTATGHRGLVFICSPTGGQWQGMGRDLFAREPVFRQKIEACDALFRDHVTWSLIEALHQPEDASRLGEIDVLQPTLFAIQVALADLWRSWGVVPDAVIGHSMGEVAACCIAGILSLEDAAKVICLRSRLVRRRAAGKGRMAIAELSATEVARRIEGYGTAVSVAAYNGPQTVILSGEEAPILELHQSLETEGVFSKLVNVDYASHSCHMDPLLPELRTLLADIQPRPRQARMVSTVTRTDLTGEEPTADYWADNLRQPVYFEPVVRSLLAGGVSHFVELSPHPNVTNAVNQVVRAHGGPASVLPSMRKQTADRAVMYDSLGVLHAEGCEIDWPTVCPTGETLHALPRYPWEREVIWPESAPLKRLATLRAAGASYEGGHQVEGSPLLGTPIHTPDGSTHLWQSRLDAKTQAYFTDHRVQDAVVLPGAAYLEIALSAANTLVTNPRLEAVRFRQAMFLENDEARTVQTILRRCRRGRFSFEIRSTTDERHWIEHAVGFVHPAKEDLSEPLIPDPKRRIANAEHRLTGSDHYTAMDRRRLQYGPAFQGIQTLVPGSEASASRLALPASVAADLGRYTLHPALLDACFQTMAGIIPSEGADRSDSDTYMPVSVQSLRVFGPIPATGDLWGQATARFDESADRISADIYLLDDRGDLLACLENLTIQRIEGGHVARRTVDQVLYRMDWEPGAMAAIDGPQASLGRVLIVGDRLGHAQALADQLRGSAEVLLVQPGEENLRLAERHYEWTWRDADDIDGFFERAYGGELPDRVIHLGNLDQGIHPEWEAQAVETALERGTMSVFHLLQALTRREDGVLPMLCVVTASSQAVTGSEPIALGQTPVWGLCRVASHEHPSLTIKLLDLDTDFTADDLDLIRRECLCTDDETQVAWRNGERMLARMVRDTPTDKRPIDRETVEALPRETPMAWRVAGAGDPNPQAFVSIDLDSPDAHEIAVQLEAVALDETGQSGSRFWDDGTLDGAGVVTAVGADVVDLQPGDRVMVAGLPYLGTHAHVARTAAARLPDTVSFEAAATLPTAMVTARALMRLGSLDGNARLFVHGLETRLGRAVARVAQAKGATVYAESTCAQESQRLVDQGVRPVLTASGRQLVDQVADLTGGRGFHWIVDALDGDLATEAASMLAPLGRYVALTGDGGRPAAPLSARIEPGTTWQAISPGQLRTQLGAAYQDLLAETAAAAGADSLQDLPAQRVTFAELVNGRPGTDGAGRPRTWVVAPGDAPVPLHRQNRSEATVKADAWYLIAGGLKGIGLATASRLAAMGARHLILLGRSGPDAQGAEQIQALRDQGVAVHVKRIDITDEQAMDALSAEIEAARPPLRGVIHSAVVIDDGLLINQTPERFARVFGPKIWGTLNLHRLATNHALDFFTVYSSASSLIGPPSQGNYAAAGNFADHLVLERRRLGLPGLTINWGPWSDIGIAAEKNLTEDYARKAVMIPFEPAFGMDVATHLLARAQGRVLAFDPNWTTYLEFFGIGMSKRLYAHMAQARQQTGVGSGGDGFDHEHLTALDEAARVAYVVERLKKVAGRILGFSPSRLQDATPINQMGLDSLMAVEMRNWIEINTGVPIPVVHFLSGDSIAQVAHLILAGLDDAPPPEVAVTPAPEVADPEALATLLDRVDDMDESEVARLLAQMEEGSG
ncbi:SDR family NAD(P)-dependent oxidoreductase [Sulfidibacter corallicola]|uniref:SDR family NAD(P)-dependent oxidoreductase n=1 Tax=Sulfidibacter corallicola TaxID=2818388 RepID=A0A8A4TJE8_SULCO|nr:type I polyketide synthase [Sulfidibacter corallicola]QTD50046.1 SDR family NAD(P)-dependent oxidoreductase [Sulfidibacter corallicola]